MPSTPDRTTIKAAVQELTSKLRDGLVADPPNAAKPFRRVAVGVGGTEDYPRPFLTLHLVRARPIGVMADDKIDDIRRTGASVVLSGDCACLMHITGASQKRKIPLIGMHIAEFLWERTHG